MAPLYQAIIGDLIHGAGRAEGQPSVRPLADGLHPRQPLQVHYKVRTNETRPDPNQQVSAALQCPRTTFGCRE
jgi:hypothetical protein